MNNLLANKPLRGEVYSEPMRYLVSQGFIGSHSWALYIKYILLSRSPLFFYLVLKITAE